MFWQLPGVWVTAVGYAGGITPNPTYEETCTGRTGHTEVVQVVFDPARDHLRRPAEGLLGEPRPDPGHAPGQRRRHPVPLGHLYHERRPGAPRPRRRATPTRRRWQAGLRARSPPRSRRAGPFYFAEDYHQEYLAKNPAGYCGIGGTGVVCPIGVGVGGGRVTARRPSHAAAMALPGATLDIKWGDDQVLQASAARCSPSPATRARTRALRSRPRTSPSRL